MARLSDWMRGHGRIDPPGYTTAATDSAYPAVGHSPQLVRQPGTDYCRDPASNVYTFKELLKLTIFLSVFLLFLRSVLFFLYFEYDFYNQ